MENDSYIVDFEEMLQRINNLEEVVMRLLSPELMYKRPGSEEHEKISDILDYLYTKVTELEQK